MVVYFVSQFTQQYITKQKRKNKSTTSNYSILKTKKMQQSLQQNNAYEQCLVATTLFDLFVRYTKTTLYIRLCDYGQRSVYQKNYSEEHVGKQINKKIQLTDVFAAIKESKDCNIYGNKRQNQENNTKNGNIMLKQYEYGDKFQNKFSALSVCQNGKITVQTKISKNGIQHIYDSQLQLQKINKSQVIQCFSRIDKYDTELKWIQKYKQLEKNLLEKQKQLQQIKHNQTGNKSEANESILQTQCLTSQIKERGSQISLTSYKSDIINNFALNGNTLTLQQLQHLEQILRKININQIKPMLIKMLEMQCQKQPQENCKEQIKQISELKQQSSAFNLTQALLRQIEQDNLISNYKPNLNHQFFSSTPQIQKLKTKIKYLEQRISDHQNIESQQNNRIIRYRAFLPKPIIEMIQPQKLQDQLNVGSNARRNAELSHQPLNHQLDQQFQQEIKRTISQYLFRAGQRKKSNQAHDGDIMVRGSHQQLNSTSESLSTLFDSSSPFYNWFKITGNVIQYVGGQGIQNLFGSWCQLLINQNIPTNTPYCFSFKIVKTDRRGIVIGVVDRKKQRNNKNPTEGNAIGYYGRWGKLTPNGTQQGTGFSQGETVKVTVNLYSHTIKWSVHNQTRAKIKNGILGDPNRQFVPYIEMRHTGDKIMWMGSSKTFASKISQ